MEQVNQIQMLQLLSEYFDEGELRTLCFVLQISYDDLPGSGKLNKARELIDYLDRHGRLSELASKGFELRSDINWGRAHMDSQHQSSADTKRPGSDLSRKQATFPSIPARSLFGTGQPITVLGLLISLVGIMLQFVFGPGNFWRVSQQPHLYRVILPQLSVQSTFIGACVVKNDGPVNARNVIVQVHSNQQVPFSALDIQGAEGAWEIRDGGQGATYVRVILPRLVATDVMTVTVMTNLPTTLRCDLASDEGIADNRPRYDGITSLFSFRFGDYMAFAVMLIVSQQIFLISMRRNLRDTSILLRPNPSERN